MSLFKKQKINSKNRKKFTGIFLIVSGILLVALFYYQSMDGAVKEVDPVFWTAPLGVISHDIRLPLAN